MPHIEYLEQVLKSQDLADDSAELETLISRRKEVEGILRAAFRDCTPTIRYGGSRAKGTLIKESYDLDLVCYFPHDSTSAGETLDEIYNNAERVLSRQFQVVRKRSALRLRDKADATDYHIDVVPGRFTDDKKTDCFLHQEQGDKDRLKTNLDVHIAHVRDSGFLDAIRLLKLWKARTALPVKQFAFELLIIQLLTGTKEPLPDQLQRVWTELGALQEPVTIRDPANPTGNDLSGLLDAVWLELSSVAASTLIRLENGGWEAVFGKLRVERDKAEGVRRAVAAVASPSRPWSDV